jgi:2-hydroxychromene-2-carboxylate isomerase
MWRDLERVCAALGIPFNKPSQFPRSSLLAARLTCIAESAWVPQFVQNVYTANFAKDLDIAQPTILLDCLQGLATDPAAIVAAARAVEAKSRLRHNTEIAMKLGIFGAPTFVIDGEIFWGNDRLETALEWGRAAQGAS